MSDQESTGAAADEDAGRTTPANDAAAEAAEAVMPTPPRGVDPNFDPANLRADNATLETLAALQTQRAQLAETKKTLTKKLKQMKKQKEHIKKKAMKLSEQDLCQIIAMKADLTNQWKAKQASRARGSADRAEDE